MFNDIWWELHGTLGQQGPGSDASTLRALAGLPDLPATPRIADLGCGPGRQTVALAKATGGTVYALDFLQPFLEQLEARALNAGVADRIHTVKGDMNAPALGDEPFDLLWSEGAIYIPGFETGLERWRPLLRPGGCAAVSELSWVSGAANATRAFWADAYPGMSDVPGNCRRADRAGYDVLDTFVLPLSDWYAYYSPIESRAQPLREKYADDPAALEVVNGHVSEVRVLEEAGGSYSYVFYLLQKR